MNPKRTATLLAALIDGWNRLQRRHHDPLHELDDRALADIGVDRSEIGSIAAESRRAQAPTRLRIVALPRHV